MKYSLLFCLVALVGCSTYRGPASVNGHPMAYDSMALGNVKASAEKMTSAQETCFDIEVSGKSVKPEQVQASNWTFAWVDGQNQYHLLPVKSREPASTPKPGVVVAPYGYYEEYSNTFSACVPRSQAHNLKSIVLTPKELPYAKKDGMKLTWNE